MSFWAGAAEGAQQRYTHFRILGRGKSSIVGSATDCRLGEQIAVKRISHVFVDADVGVEVLREVRLLRECNHPNIVALKSIVPPDDMSTFDTIFVVEEYMESDLRQLLRPRSQQSRPRITTGQAPEAVCSYMAQMLAGLAHVHALGAIHRDLKPENILLSPSRTSTAHPHGLVKLADFGLARIDPNAARGASPRRPSHRHDVVARRRTLAADALVADAPASEVECMMPTLKRQMTSHVVTRCA